MEILFIIQQINSKDDYQISELGCDFIRLFFRFKLINFGVLTRNFEDKLSIMLFDKSIYFREFKP